jgi:hypothetical protein
LVIVYRLQLPPHEPQRSQSWLTDK